MTEKSKVFIPIEDVAQKPAETLWVAGLTRFTTIDYPGCLSAVAFIQGCPWKCVYCQNKELQKRSPQSESDIRANGRESGEARVSWTYIESFLTKRKGLIDGFVFSGGEPCLDPALPDAVKRVKAMGYKIGLHTGGMYPNRLESMIPDLDWVGLDIKAPLTEPHTYDRVVGRRGSVPLVTRSLERLLRSGIDLEVRTTIHPDYLNEDQLLALASDLRDRGVKTYALQIYRQPRELPENEVLERVGAHYPNDEVLQEIRGYFPHFILRRN